VVAEIAAARLAIAPPPDVVAGGARPARLCLCRGKRAASARSSPAAVTATVHDGFAQRDLPPLRASLDDADEAPALGAAAVNAACAAAVRR
jgi:hypothetical protein